MTDRPVLRQGDPPPRTTPLPACPIVPAGLAGDDSGILERLRGWRARRHEAGLDYLCNAAADEIERLRARIEPPPTPAPAGCHGPWPGDGPVEAPRGAPGGPPARFPQEAARTMSCGPEAPHGVPERRAAAVDAVEAALRPLRHRPCTAGDARTVAALLRRLRTLAAPAGETS